jgi:sugar phosphate permease
MNEQQVFAKCAWRLIPFMMLLFIVNYVDRTNIGFAALTMNKDLGFSPAIYGFGASVFFISYVSFQVPAKFHPSANRRPALDVRDPHGMEPDLRVKCPGA